MEVFCPMFKKLSHICQKIFSFCLINEAFLKKLLIFQEETFRHLKIKKSCYEKKSYILRYGTFFLEVKNTHIFLKKQFFLYFMGKLTKPVKQKFLIFL